MRVVGLCDNVDWELHKRCFACAGAQWATHPGLRSAPILLKFLKNDTALAIGAHEGDKLDTTPLHLNKYHNSYRTALKVLEAHARMPHDFVGGSVGISPPS
jgi:hypothetical protein